MKLMAFFANKVVTPTKEGFGLKSKKKLVISHGINTDLFRPGQETPSAKLRIISVGRISPIKNYETLIEAVELIKDKINLQVNIIGGPGIKEQEIYFNKVKWLVREKGLGQVIRFQGLIPNQELPKHYQKSDILINLCPTGSPDKAVLEAMSCALPVLVCNRTFKTDFGHYSEQLLFKEKDSKGLAKKILNLAANNQLKEIGLFLRRQVVKNHNLDNLVSKIIGLFKS